MNSVGALNGLALGIGAMLLITFEGAWSARVYRARIEAQLGNAAAPRRSLTQRIVQRLLDVDRAERIAQRQRRAGIAVDPAVHVLQRIAWSLGGGAIGTALLVALTSAGRVRQPIAGVVLIAISALTGYLLVEHLLDRKGKQRLRTAGIELPAVAELLALTVAAGAALPRAIDVVAGRSQGVIANEMSAIALDTARGMPIDAALAAFASRLPLTSVQRFVEAMRIALDRGTPIVDVLHAQASDARHEYRRLLLESAGRREIAMLIPVVFFILPAVVVIALYPGMQQLDLVI